MFFFLPRKLKVDGNKCRNKSEKTFLAQVAKDKSHEICKTSLATIYFRSIFFPLIFLPLKYRNNKNTKDLMEKFFISLVTLSFGKTFNYEK